MQHVDLTVVGASFAGLSCAQAAAARGLLVNVIERKADPGEGIRTTGVLVKEVADDWQVPRRLTRKVHGIRLYGPSLRGCDFHSPGYYFLATDTPQLLRWLVRETKFAGAQVVTGTAFHGALRHKDEWVLAGHELSSRYLVGADGARSRVAATMGLGINRRFLVGQEVELTGVRGVDEDLLHCFLDSRLAPGYMGWVVPGMNGVTQIGVARRWPGKPDLSGFLQQVGKVFDLSCAREQERRAGLIPVGGPVGRVAGEGVMLVGDAAGMVSPLTAGGIHTAVQFGRRAGIAITDHLLDGGEEPWEVLRREAPRFVWKRLLRKAIDAAPPNFVLDLALSMSPVRRLAQTIFYHHRGLFTLKAWRDLVQARAG